MGNPEQQADATLEPNNSGKTVDYEKRFKDTQSAYTKSQQELKAAKAKLEALESLTTPKVELAPEVQEELEDLKYSNPDKWRAKLNELEEEAKTKHREVLTEAERAAIHQAELENRARVLEEFQSSHPDLVINDEVIKYDVPPRITSKLESGTINFEQFLSEVASYLKVGKVIGDGNTTLNQPNLGNVGGDGTPTKTAVDKDIVKNYGDLVF